MASRNSVSSTVLRVVCRVLYMAALYTITNDSQKIGYLYVGNVNHWRIAIISRFRYVSTGRFPDDNRVYLHLFFRNPVLALLCK